MDVKKETISVVIPAKNEAQGLLKLLPSLNDLDGIEEILVVNDGSTDSTEEVCKEFSVRCISHPYSKGNGASVKTGARNAVGDVLVFMDGDGQHQAEDLGKLLEKYREGFDMVVGARSKDGQANGLRYIANSFYNRFSSWMTEKRIEDLTSGFRVVNAKKFREFLYMLPNGFSYPTTSTMAFFRVGYSVGYEPINVLKREGKSHINLFKDGLKFLLIIFKVATLYSPLRLFAPIAFLIFSMGLSYYGYTYINFGRYTNMSATLMMSSVLVFLIGLVSEQISTLYYKD